MSQDGIGVDEERRWSPHGSGRRKWRGANATIFAKIFATLTAKNGTNSKRLLSRTKDSSLAATTDARIIARIDTRVIANHFARMIAAATRELSARG